MKKVFMYYVYVSVISINGMLYFRFVCGGDYWYFFGFFGCFVYYRCWCYVVYLVSDNFGYCFVRFLFC